MIKNIMINNIPKIKIVINLLMCCMWQLPIDSQAMEMLVADEVGKVCKSHPIECLVR